MADPRQPAVDVPALTALLDGSYADVRNLTRKRLAEHAQVLVDAREMSRPEFRERVVALVRELAATGQTGLGFPLRYGGGGDIGASVAAFETMAFGDLSVLVKVGVQFGLFGGAILQLGTKKHHDVYLERLVRADLLGCFAMTETGHGSNVQALGTVARYDEQTQEFVIRTPDETTSATPPHTPSWRSSSPSWRSGTRRRACTPSWCPSGTTAASCCPAYASRTTGARSV